MNWRARMRGVRRDTATLYLCARDGRVPWRARLVGAAVVAYALSPIDLIPDFIPVFGVVDDLLLIPAGLWLFRRMVPDEVFEENRVRATDLAAAGGRAAWFAAVLVVCAWAAAAAAALWVILR